MKASLTSFLPVLALLFVATTVHAASPACAHLPEGIFNLRYSRGDQSTFDLNVIGKLLKISDQEYRLQILDSKAKSIPSGEVYSLKIADVENVQGCSAQPARLTNSAGLGLANLGSTPGNSQILFVTGGNTGISLQSSSDAQSEGGGIVSTRVDLVPQN